MLIQISSKRSNSGKVKNEIQTKVMIFDQEIK